MLAVRLSASFFLLCARVAKQTNSKLERCKMMEFYGRKHAVCCLLFPRQSHRHTDDGETGAVIWKKLYNFSASTKFSVWSITHIWTLFIIWIRLCNGQSWNKHCNVCKTNCRRKVGHNFISNTTITRRIDEIYSSQDLRNKCPFYGKYSNVFPSVYHVVIVSSQFGRLLLSLSASGCFFSTSGQCVLH